MPEYNRVVVSGTLGEGAEAWSVGCNFIPDVGPTVQSPADLNEWAADIADALTSALPSALANGLSTSGAIDQVDTYFYAAIGAPAISAGVATLDKQGASVAALPLSTACVASLRTGLSGRRYRGRLFWPAVGWAMDPDGTFDNTIWSTFSSGMATFLSTLAEAAPIATDLRPAIVSVAGGFVTPVTSISADNAPDSQRRRDDSVADATQTASYPPA